MEKIDTQALALLVDRCFDLSMDGRLSRSQRSRFLILAKRLRGSLLNLISARFEEDAKGLAEANAELVAIGERLGEEGAKLQKVADTLVQLGKLVGSLDRLLGVAASFL